MARLYINTELFATQTSTFDGSVTINSGFNQTASATCTFDGIINATDQANLNKVEVGGTGDVLDKIQKETLAITTFTVGGHLTNVQTITITGLTSSDFILPAKPANVDDEIIVTTHATTDAVVLKFNNTSNQTSTSTATQCDIMFFSFS